MYVCTRVSRRYTTQQQLTLKFLQVYRVLVRAAKSWSAEDCASTVLEDRALEAAWQPFHLICVQENTYCVQQCQSI